MIEKLLRHGIVLLMILVFPVLASSAKDLQLERERVRTPEGTFYMWHRSPAGKDDIAMPIVDGGTVQSSIVYRVRDRKMRDLLFLARVQLTTPRPSDEIRRFYLNAFGKDAAQETDKKTGDITVTAGEKTDFRLVVISPKEHGCAVRLEHVQQFSIPERVYTDNELRVIRVLDALDFHYQSSRRVSYTMDQTTVFPGDKTSKQPPMLTWNVNFVRPAQITVTAAVGDTVGVRITTENNRLRVHPQIGVDAFRPFQDGIVIDDLPEMQDDPAAQLMLGATLMNPQLDFLGIDTVPGVPASQQARITLTYPDDHQTVCLTVDLQHNIILRSETTIVDEDRTVKVTRIYKNVVIEPVVLSPKKGTSPQPQLPQLTPEHGPHTAVTGP